MPGLRLADELPSVDAVWILGPNDTRLDHMRAISRAVEDGVSPGCCLRETPGRNLVEAREMLRLGEEAVSTRLPGEPGLLDGRAGGRR